YPITRVCCALGVSRAGYYAWKQRGPAARVQRDAVLTAEIRQVYLAMAESFFATFKSELIDRVRWSTRRAARPAIFAWLEVFDHRQRRHSALGYLSPVAHEERHNQTAAA